MVKNQTTKTIFIRGGPESLLTEVLPKTEMPLHFDPACFESVRMALDPMDGGWSAGFSVTNTGRDVVKVKGADGKEMLLRVVRELHGGTWFMHLSVEKHWPMVLKNSSGFTLLFSQKVPSFILSFYIRALLAKSTRLSRRVRARSLGMSR